MILSEFTSTSKVNLFLEVTGQDPADGYHFLESIFVEIPWGDDFTVRQAETDQVVFTGLGAEAIPGENTVSKALGLFKEKFAIAESYRIDIWKNVPHGAGLGGGSGDAGAILRYLCGRHRKKMADIAQIASAVGSDVPFFLTGGSAHVRGKGEKISPLAGRLDPSMGMLIAVPPVKISTKEAFQSLNGNFNHNNTKNLKHFSKKNLWGLDFLKENSYNIFEKIPIGPNGPLENIYETIKRAAAPPLIMMTGSGSGFVLFYSSPQDAAAALTFLNDSNCGIYTQQIWW